MNRRMKSIVLTFDLIIEVLFNNKAYWEGNIPFTDAFKFFVDNRDKIRHYARIQTQDNTGLAAKKDEIKEELIDQYLDIASYVLSYADSIDDVTLYKAYDYTMSTLLKLGSNELINKSTNITDHCTNNLKVLEPFSLSPEKIDTFKGVTKQYANIYVLPRKAIEEKKTATKEIDDRVKEGMSFLKLRMDKEMRTYRVSHPDFYSNYKNARLIVDPYTHTLSVVGNVIDKTTEEPLIGVVVLIAKIDQQTKTSDLGNFRFKSVTEGIHEVSFEYPGYKTLTEKIAIVSGQRINLDVSLEKEIE